MKVAERYSQRLGADLALVHKTRPRNGGQSVEARHVVGDVAGRHCVLIDDMIVSISAWLSDPSGAATPNIGELFVHDTSGGNPVEAFPKQGAGWQQLSLNFVASLTGSVRIHLIHHPSAGPLYWDDVLIIPK